MKNAMNFRQMAKTAVVTGAALVALAMPFKNAHAQGVGPQPAPVLRLPPGHADTTFCLNKGDFKGTGRIVADVDSNFNIKASKAEYSTDIIHYWKSGWQDTATVVGLFGSTLDSTTWKGSIHSLGKDTLDIWAVDSMSANRHLIFVNGQLVTNVYGNDSLSTRDSLSQSGFVARISNFSQAHDNAKDLFYSKATLTLSQQFSPPLALSALLPATADTLWMAPMHQIGVLPVGEDYDVKFEITVVENPKVRLYGMTKDTVLPASLYFKAIYADTIYKYSMGTKDLALDKFFYAQEFIYPIVPILVDGNVVTKVYYKADKAIYGGDVNTIVWPGDTTWHNTAGNGINMFNRVSAMFGIGASSTFGFDGAMSMPGQLIFDRVDGSKLFDWLTFPDSSPFELTWGKFKTWNYSTLKLLGYFTSRVDTNGFEMTVRSPTQIEMTLNDSKTLHMQQTEKQDPKATPTHKKEVINGVWDAQTLREYGLEAYPSPPADGRATLQISLLGPKHLRIQVFDILGRVVGEAADASFQTGISHVVLDLRMLPSGIYLVGERNGPKIRLSKP